MGQNKVAQILHLRISWDRDEDSGEAVEDNEVGPYSISIMGIFCSLWMPKLKKVELKKVEFDHIGPAQRVHEVCKDREDGGLIADERVKDNFIEKRGCTFDLLWILDL